ncbi:DUF2924 domain-containing protein [Aquisediminimonas sediminicola]|uniref:DUF2924 domain-containing protein n=1 Tax=Alteraquisediminimonas sediminicola TaxID=2676787 RepID=UPI001C8CF9C0|nr:DUF2924 domain-containing protein [Aquisediminimonas sediminicola]
MSALDEQLAALTTMSAVLLRAEWLRLHKVPAPAMTTDLLRRGIAHRLQERAKGGMPSGTLRELGRLCRHYARTGAVEAAQPSRIKPGTRLVRDWGGESHHVVVLERGYLYRDENYASLSQIATEITGAKWSGPRFFGLIKRKKAEVAHA